jgi:F-type H+-transporting ATPase subunit epsilon
VDSGLTVAKLHVDIVTVEGRRFAGEADFVVAPGSEGELGILPHHMPLLTALKVGTIKVVNDGADQFFFVSGGFLEVRPDQVTVLADSAERAEDIDEARAEEARRRAARLLEEKVSAVDQSQLAAALARAEARLRIAELRRRARR